VEVLIFYKQNILSTVILHY